jgi:penicillin-binding protein A
MNSRIRRLGFGLLAAYLALFVMLNVIQVARADDYNTSPLNNRAIVRDYAKPRGNVLSADGVLLATSVPVDDRYQLLRTYPTGDLFAHVTGSFSFLFGSEGVERQYNDDLTAGSDRDQTSGLGAFVPQDRPNDVVLTLRADLQQLAKDQLGDREGAVVALDPRDGSILAMWSWPAPDPNELSSHDFDRVRDIRALYLLDPRNPLRAASYRDRYVPGSTFKVVTAAAGLDSGLVTGEQPVYPVETQFTPPQTSRPVGNFGGSECGGALIEIMARSCNTSFARMGLDVGAEVMVETATRFGFDATVPIDLPGSISSNYPDVAFFDENLPALAQSAFGQNEVQASPLHMAMVAGAIGNGGTMMVPHVMGEVRAGADTPGAGGVRRRFDVAPWRDAVSPSSAEVLRQAMTAVVDGGTGTRAQIPGVSVAGKTGTAQVGTEPPTSHAWFVGFAPAEAPTVAVAVILESQPGVSEVTGGRLAAPIAQAIMARALGVG